MATTLEGSLMLANALRDSALIGALLLAVPASAQTPIPQPRKVAAILIETSDCPYADSEDVDERIWTNPLTPVPAEASDRILISGRERWLAASYDILDLVRDSNGDSQPDIFGPYEVSGLCTDECEYSAWGTEAKADAIAEVEAACVDLDDPYDCCTGFETDNGNCVDEYDHYIHYMPGGNGDEPAVNICSSQEPGGWAGLGNAFTHVWINGWLNAGLIMHEIGHNLHVQASDDPTDLMGTNDIVGLNAPHMLQLEFLISSHVEVIGSNDTVTLLPLYVDPYDFPGTRVVKILAPSGDPYYVSFRDDSNIDINLRAEDKFAGFIHRWDGDQVVSDRQRIKVGDIFVAEERTFRVKVISISEGDHWEMEIQVTFDPIGLLAYQEPN
jgi:hypothetical protein